MPQITLSADYDADTTNSVIAATGTTLRVKESFGDFRTALRFDITTLPVGATVTNVELIVRVVTAVGGRTANVQAYNQTGQVDPSGDSASTMYTRCGNDASPYLTDDTFLQATGGATLTLGSTVATDVEAARSAGTVFSLGIRATDVGASTAAIEAVENAGTDEPKLRITYSLLSVSVSEDITVSEAQSLATDTPSVSVADAITVADSPGASRLLELLVSESAITVSESVNALVLIEDRSVSVSESITVSDSPTPFIYNSFSSSFETGDFSEWTGNTPDGGDLSVTAAAALHGAYGLSILINDTAEKDVWQQLASAVTRYRCRFYIHPNSLTMANNDSFTIFRTSNISDDAAFQVILQYTTANGYRVLVQDRADGAWDAGTNYYVLSNSLHWIEIDWQASSAPAANDGTLSLWIDGQLRETVTGIDSDTETVFYFNLGAYGGLDAGTSGTFYLDDFDCNNDGTAINGLLSAPIVALPGLGMNMAWVALATFQDHTDQLKAVGYTQIRPSFPDWNNATQIADSKDCATYAVGQGLEVVWGVSSGGVVLTSTNWPDYVTAVTSAATWAQANGVFEFQLGNEEEYHVDGTTLTIAQLIINMKALATDIQAIFTNGNVSYTCWQESVDDWIAAGKGDIDILASNIYMGGAGVYTSATWETRIADLLTAFGASGTYLTEFGVSYTSLADYSSDEFSQAVALSRMIEYIRASGMTRSMFFQYYGTSHGALKTDDTYRQLWPLLISDLEVSVAESVTVAETVTNEVASSVSVSDTITVGEATTISVRAFQAVYVVSVAIYGKYGKNKLAELDEYVVDREFVLSGEGSGHLALPVNNRNATSSILDIHNFVFVRSFAGAENWAGYIETHGWGLPPSYVSLDLRGLAGLLTLRVTDKVATYTQVTAGAIISDLLAKANAYWPTGVVEGTINRGGPQVTKEWKFTSLKQVVDDLHKETNYEYWFTVSEDTTRDQLLIKLHWGPRGGR